MRISDLDKRIQRSGEEFERQQRADWAHRVPEITFVLYKAGGAKNRLSIEVIADHAESIYPDSFVTSVGGYATPDLAVMLMALGQATGKDWGYMTGDWYKGWRLTKKGQTFAQDIERRNTDMRAKDTAKKRKLSKIITHR
jgi:hypothetical protein